MGISLKTHKMLWGRAGNRCAMPECRIELVMDATETDDESLIGEECHIVAKSPDGPRGDASFPKDKINKYENLILMCRVHHKIIDDQTGTYTISFLNQLKSEHEQWVRESLEGFDPQKQRDDEIYASYAEKWIDLGHLNEWKGWTSFIFGSDDPRLFINIDNSLDELKEWLFSRIWPKRYEELEDAFENFRRVLQDFRNTFHEHAEKAKDILYTRKFYQIDEWNEEKYERLGKKYEFHVVLVQDLMLELTRAANYICDKIRTYIDRSFRLDEGALIVESGPYMPYTWRQHRVEYRGDERTKIPYPGLNEFKKIRKDRDYCFGVGDSSKDPEFLEWYRSRE